MATLADFTRNWTVDASDEEPPVYKGGRGLEIKHTAPPSSNRLMEWTYMDGPTLTTCVIGPLSLSASGHLTGSNVLGTKNGADAGHYVVAITHSGGGGTPRTIDAVVTDYSGAPGSTAPLVGTWGADAPANPEPGIRRRVGSARKVARPASSGEQALAQAR